MKYVNKAVKLRNWTVALAKVMDLTEAAETKFAEGAERTEQVLAMLKSGAAGRTDCLRSLVRPVRGQCLLGADSKRVNRVRVRTSLK